MTPRDFFIVVIRILGLITLGSFLFELPGYLVTFFTTSFSGSSISGLVIIAVTSLMLWFVLERPHWLVDKLGVAKGFDQEMFNINWPAEKFLNAALIVTSAIVLFREIPNLSVWVFNYFQMKDLTHGLQRPDLSYIPRSIARIVLALLLFGERERVVSLIGKDRTKA